MGYIKTSQCPYKYKYQLVGWASKRFKKSKTVVSKLSRAQLYAIWYKIRSGLNSE